jgi:hypothetical protein
MARVHRPLAARVAWLVVESRDSSRGPGAADGRMAEDIGLRRAKGARSTTEAVRWEFRWFLFRTASFRDHFGNIVKWYRTNTDIDDLKRAQVKLRQDEENFAESRRPFRTG